MVWKRISISVTIWNNSTHRPFLPMWRCDTHIAIQINTLAAFSRTAVVFCLAGRSERKDLVLVHITQPFRTSELINEFFVSFFPVSIKVYSFDAFDNRECIKLYNFLKNYFPLSAFLIEARAKLTTPSSFSFSMWEILVDCKWYVRRVLVFNC